MDKNTWYGLGAAAFALAFVFLTQNTGSSAKDLEKETMQVHDAAMKEMADMNRLGRLLKHEMETLDSLAPRRDSLRDVVGQMKRAEEGMYGWMQQYSPPTKLSDEDARKYLTEQKKMIGQNYRDMQNAAAAARQLLAR